MPVRGLAGSVAQSRFRLCATPSTLFRKAVSGLAQHFRQFSTRPEALFLCGLGHAGASRPEPSGRGGPCNGPQPAESCEGDAEFSRG